MKCFKYLSLNLLDKDLIVVYMLLIFISETIPGFPKSYYINASWVKIYNSAFPLYIFVYFKINFPQFEQKIIAVQAPKNNMVSGFWQMVLDNNVTVIVIITKLVENNVVKSDQYWPTQDKPCIELENSIKVIFKSEEVDKGLVRSVFGVSNGGRYL